MTERRVALFVDGDNVSPRHSRMVLQEAGKLGRVDVARVYADASRPSEWLSTAGYLPVHAGSGKNAADILLCIDAMELALASGFEAFVVATSDRDFTHLARRLRERGSMVLGLGETKCPESFRQACTRFACLAEAEAGEGAAASEFDRKIRAMISRHSVGGTGMRITELNIHMKRAHGTLIGEYPGGSWRAYLSARPDLYDLDPRGGEAKVRFRPAGFSTR